MRAITLGATGALLIIITAGLALGAEAPVRFPSPLSPAKVPSAAYAAGVIGAFDRTYSILVGYRPLKLDVFYDPGASEPRPAVVWIHGGGWVRGDPLSGTAETGPRDELLARMAARGYVLVGLTYRFAEEAKFPASVNDVKAAVRWLRANAATYHIDPRRIALWGASAGGYLATLAGVTCGDTDLEGQGGNPTESSCVQAVIDWFGVLEFRPFIGAGGANEALIESFLGCSQGQCSDESLRRSDPLSYIKAGDPPFLIMHGDADTMVPIQQSKDLLAALRAHGVTARMETIHGANHEWIGMNKAQVEAIYTTVQEFLDKTFAVKPHRAGSGG
jgi:acetyl esterase/lipase